MNDRMVYDFYTQTFFLTGDSLMDDVITNIYADKVDLKTVILGLAHTMKLVAKRVDELEATLKEKESVTDPSNG